MPARSTPVHGWTVGEPRSACADPVRAQRVRGASAGVAFLLVTFLTPRILRSALRAGFAVRAAPAAQWPPKEK